MKQPSNSEKRIKVANLKYQIENDTETTREVFEKFATEETDVFSKSLKDKPFFFFAKKKKRTNL